MGFADAARGPPGRKGATRHQTSPCYVEGSPLVFRPGAQVRLVGCGLTWRLLCDPREGKDTRWEADIAVLQKGCDGDHQAAAGILQVLRHLHLRLVRHAVRLRLTSIIQSAQKKPDGGDQWK